MFVEFNQDVDITQALFQETRSQGTHASHCVIQTIQAQVMVQRRGDVVLGSYPVPNAFSSYCAPNFSSFSISPEFPSLAFRRGAGVRVSATLSRCGSHQVGSDGPPLTGDEERDSTDTKVPILGEKGTPCFHHTLSSKSPLKALSLFSRLDGWLVEKK